MILSEDVNKQAAAVIGGRFALAVNELEQIYFDNFFKSPEIQPKIKNNPENILNNYAFLYTCTATGSNSGIHFMMSIEDAEKWCESTESQGVYMGTQWAYFFTTVNNFFNCHWGQSKDSCINLCKVIDNGKWDAKILSMGLTKFNKYDIKQILGQVGIQVLV